MDSRCIRSSQEKGLAVACTFRPEDEAVVRGDSVWSNLGENGRFGG
jgi:hypothetical protein